MDLQISIFDAWSSISQSALFYKLIQPEFIVNDNFNELFLIGCENMLDKLVKSNFVPFDFVIQESKNNRKEDFINYPLLNSNNKINIITGSNNSGKSVFIKTLATSVYLAQCGFPIKANVYFGKIFNNMFYFEKELDNTFNLIVG